ncbi:oxidoreductase [Sphingomonas oryzagri]
MTDLHGNLMRAGEGASRNGRFHALLAPLQVGANFLQNRVVMGAMHTGIERRDRSLERIHAFYRARVKGEVGLIITGGVAPNADGMLEAGSPMLSGSAGRDWHEAVLDAVRGSETKICMQLLHAGRYGKTPQCVAPSAIKANINQFTPRALSTDDIWRTIDDFAQASVRAREFGYHGVEIMGSEGYLINQFTAPRTNARSDMFGGSLANRIRFPIEIIKAVREATGPEFLIIYRISAVDLVEGGMSGGETIELARHIEAAGADLLNTGIGWHEASIPTVAQVVPRAAFAYAVRHVKHAMGLPVIASNRINDPDVADALISGGTADLVSMARPLLADPEFVSKTRLAKVDTINTCIACNQACLDRAFRHEVVSCLVNPRAAQEIEYPETIAAPVKRIAVVGAGAAGMTFAFNAANRGHAVTLFEAADQIGGQLLMAKAVPDKSEFNELLRYCDRRLADERVDVRLNSAPTVEELTNGAYDEIVIATGVRPRDPPIDGIKHPKVMSYIDVLRHRRSVGRRVAIIGAGGIGFDVAEFLLGQPEGVTGVDAFAQEYGLDISLGTAGGLVEVGHLQPPGRLITMMQRRPGIPAGNRQAVTTNWIKRKRLRRMGVELLGGVSYDRIDDEGLHISVAGQSRLIAADTIITCAGQSSERSLYDALIDAGSDIPVHAIGGADHAGELDAMRAIEQATRLALVL